MSTTRKLILLTHLLKNHGVPRMNTKLAKRFCQEAGIQIVQILHIRKSVSILVDERQGGDALNFWKEQKALKAAKEIQVLPDEGTRVRLEDRMLEHERLLNRLIAAQNQLIDGQNIAADRQQKVLHLLTGGAASNDTGSHTCRSAISTTSGS